MGAALQAEQAQANLERYVYGVPVSSVPPSVSPMPPAAMHPFPVRNLSMGLLLVPPAPAALGPVALPEAIGTSTSSAAATAEAAAAVTTKRERSLELASFL